MFGKLKQVKDARREAKKRVEQAKKDFGKQVEKLASKIK